MRIRAAVAATVLLVLGLGGCSETDLTPTSPNTSGTPQQAISVVQSACEAQPTEINGYAVEFLGRTVANNQTTFSYRVYGTTAETAATHFTVELPPCAPAPVSYAPTGGVSINNNPQAGVYGIEWHTSITPTGDPAEFSVTFPGDIPQGVVRSIVKRSSPYEVGVVPGPCAGFQISGSVFVDADSSLTKDGNETGIANVTVSLTDAEGCVSTATTDAAGAYLFIRGDGDYTVAVSLSTPEDDFNEELATAFSATTVLTREVTVGPDATGTDFGFIAETGKVKSDISNGVLLTNGEGLRFWKKQLQAATKNGGGAVHTRAELEGFLLAIEGLALSDPYQFAAGDEIAGAIAILTDRDLKKVALLGLKAALLVTELNHVSGRGLTSLELQLNLIAYGESIIAGATSGLRTTGGDGERLRDPTFDGETGMYSAMNNDNPIVYGGTGGGGGDE